VEIGTGVERFKSGGKRSVHFLCLLGICENVYYNKIEISYRKKDFSRFVFNTIRFEYFWESWSLMRVSNLESGKTRDRLQEKPEMKWILNFLKSREKFKFQRGREIV